MFHNVVSKIQAMQNNMANAIIISFIFLPFRKIVNLIFFAHLIFSFISKPKMGRTGFSITII